MYPNVGCFCRSRARIRVLEFIQLDAFVEALPVLWIFDDIVTHVVVTLMVGVLDIRKASETHLRRSWPSTRVLLKAGVWKNIFFYYILELEIHKVYCPLKGFRNKTSKP